jgi:PAS domain S-box-containing protein
VVTKQDMQGNEEKLRILTQFAQDAIIQVNSDGLITYWNKSAERLFGYIELEALNKNLHILIAPKHFHAAYLKGFSKFKKTGQGAAIGKTLELEGKRNNGIKFPIELSLSSFQVNGEWNAVGIIRDISKRKRMEQKLRDSEEELRNIFDNVNDAIYIRDLKGNFIDVNATACKRLGYEKREFLQMHIRDINTPENIAKNPKLFDEKLPLVKDIIETVHVTKSGKKIPVEIRGKQSLYQNEPVIIAVSRDITNRKKDQNKIKERLKELTCLYELSKIAGEKKFNADSFLKEAINLISPAWQFPELTCAKITVEKKEYKTDNYRETKWHQTSKIYIENQKIGEMEVGYLEETPIFDEGPFLKEERNLINGISEILSGALELKLTEEKLKQSEANHRNMITNLDVGFYQIKLGGKILNHNPAYNKILGYDEFENLKNTNVTNLWENPELREEYLQQLLRDDFVKNYICHAIKKDGSKVVLQLNTHVMRDVEGKPIRIDGTFIDVTEKFNLEKKLKKSLEATKIILDSLPIGIILVDYDRKVQSVNKVALKLLEFNDEFEILGKLCHNVMCVAEIGACPVLDMGGKIDQSERFLINQFGKEVPILKSVIPITLGDNNYLLEAFVDVSSLKETEEKLKESQEKYRDLLYTSTLGILDINLVSREIEYFNPILLELIGYSKEELIVYDQFFGIIHPEDIQKLLKSRDDGVIEFRIITKDGKRKWIECNRIYQYDKKGEVIKLRLWMQDISERKKGESLKRLFTEQLEKKVQSRTKDLIELLEKQKLYLDQIEKSSRFKTEFMATISHELRTPLNAIIGFTDLLLENVFGELNEEQLEFVEDIDESSKHLLEMITHILDISKIEAGQAVLTVEEINLNNLVNRVISTLKPLYNEKRLIIDLKGLKKKQLICADRIKFKQIIYNLLSNAIKFTEKGKVTFEFRDSKNTWDFIVEDTGIGIAEKDFNIIFKEFKRVESAYIDSIPGSGLGLALTKRVVNLHGGEILFTSKLGKGTTFTFTIPKNLRKKVNKGKKVESFMSTL